MPVRYRLYLLRERGGRESGRKEEEGRVCLLIKTIWKNFLLSEKEISKREKLRRINNDDDDDDEMGEERCEGAMGRKGCEKE